MDLHRIVRRESVMDEIPGLSCPALAGGGPGAWPATLADGHAGPARVLVVEAQRELATALASYLRGAGYEVCTASDGLAALYGLRHHRPDLVVLDLDVPRVSGFRLLRLLKEDRVEGPLPVVVVTALSFDEAREAARAGADGFLELPCSPAEVLAHVRQIFSRDTVQSPFAAPAIPAGSSPRLMPATQMVPAAVEVAAA